MSTPGIADPYWFEWYVGMENIIKMLNPDNGIEYVVFQCASYDTIDDVTVGYKNGTMEVCYQVKHEISTSVKNNFTFGNLLKKEKEDDKCLLAKIALGWKNAMDASKCGITPVLFTNRVIGSKKSNRKFNGTSYKAYPIPRFIELVKGMFVECTCKEALIFADKNLELQWGEMVNAIGVADIDNVIEFMQSFNISGNNLGLENAERQMVESLAAIFSCSESLAKELFIKLNAELRIWTTTRRTNEKITIEDVYSVLGTEIDRNEHQHRLAPPHPFFESRSEFCNNLAKLLQDTPKKVVFFSGNPGSGKTSIISHLQSESRFFLIRYHTFRPISPEQRFYNLDEGLCTPENLWGTMLIQLRNYFKGRLAEFNVPLNNKFCTTQELRSQVVRLLTILGSEAVSREEKIFVCIDGLDHAARASSDITFLSTLLLPNEIPDGVCFVVVGQPQSMYPKYPSWLTASDSVELVSVPLLDLEDIKQLILFHAPQFLSIVDGIAKLVFETTQGNNLSVVFSIEKLRHIASEDDAILCVKQSGISDDVQQYYQHIWNFVKQETSKIGLNIPYPESIIACPLLLMNGTVNTKILSRALSYNIRESDWKTIFDKLHPLIASHDNGESYAIFHNDFRVFLMGVVKNYQPQYSDIAEQLATYLLSNDEGLLTYVRGIPLLCAANKHEQIPNYFTPSFVFNALAEGVSKFRLDEYARLSYNEVCRSQNEDAFLSTYSALKTLYQHEQYFEYYERVYPNGDYPEISNLDILEVRTNRISKDSLGEFSDALRLCVKLNSSDLQDHIKRANVLYGRWFSSLTPQDVLSSCEVDMSQEEPWQLESSDIGLLLKQWGETAAILGLVIPDMNRDSSNDVEAVAIMCIGDSYFNTCIKLQKYQLAYDALGNNVISRHCFSKNLEAILYENQAELFKDYLYKLTVDVNNQATKWFAATILALKSSDIHFSTEEAIDFSQIHDVHYDSNFTMALYAFMVGCSEPLLNDSIVCSHAKVVYSKLEDDEKDISHVSWIVRLACLIGKYTTLPSYLPSEALTRHISWFLNTGIGERFYYSKAHKFIFFATLNYYNRYKELIDNNLIESLKTLLFSYKLEVDSRLHALDFLQTHGYSCAIKEYILFVYGADGNEIFQVEDFVKLHSTLLKYGNTVLPELMEIVSSKIKWDVVGYTGHKEYAMSASLDSFDALATLNPSSWRDSGQSLYRQSLIADRADNRLSYEIEKRVVKAAINSSFSEYWEVLSWDRDFVKSPGLIHDSLCFFIEIAKSKDDIVLIWLCNCGIQSWYTQRNREQSKEIFDLCVKKSNDIGIDFHAEASKLTPEWIDIVVEETRIASMKKDDDYIIKRAEEMNELALYYGEMEQSQLLHEIPLISNNYYAMDHLSSIFDRLESDGLLSDRDIQIKLLHCLSDCLSDRDWAREYVDKIISKLLSLIGKEVFWHLADNIKGHLSDYNYFSSSRNMHLLLKLKAQNDENECKHLFEAEIALQRMWTTGNNHFSIDDEVILAKSVFPAPNSFVETALFILFEQIGTRNGRKINSAIFGIYKLGTTFPEALNVIASNWSILSEFQQEQLLIPISRWSIDAADNFKKLYDVLLSEYEQCNKLARKYYLDSILKNYSPNDPRLVAFIFSADSAEYVLSDNQPPHPFSQKRHISFLTLCEEWYDDPNMNNDIRRYITSLGNETLQDDSVKRFSEAGDCILSITCQRTEQVLYGEEKKGRWIDIPIIFKKHWLLKADDPFMLTEMPTVVYDSEWFFDTTNLKNSGENKTSVMDKKSLSKIVHHNCNSDEIVLGACLWLPLSRDEGVLYHEIAKIDSGMSFERSYDVEKCLGNWGLLYKEGFLFDNGSSFAQEHGISLFYAIVGSMIFHHGNCQIAPSSAWKEIFGCTPHDNPYQWNNTAGVNVLRFERIASPYRRVIHEQYYRQPILFRWLCNKDWLEHTMNDKNFRFRYVYEKQKMP